MPAFLALVLSFIIAGPTSAPMPAPSASPAPTASPSAKESPKPSPTPATRYAALKWREMGPASAGGRVAAVAGSATDPDLYYIGAAGGGVWKSENGGQTWDPVFDDEDVQSIGAVTIAPSDDKTVWVGTGEANPRNDVLLGDGIYRSTDAATTWKKMGLSDVQTIARIAVDPKDVNHVVVAGIGDLFKDSRAGGIYVTYDGGKTWTHSLYVGPSSGGSDVTFDPSDASIVYAGIWQFRREPWTASSGGPDDGLFKSTDGGKSWARLAGHGLPAGLMGRIALAISRSDPHCVYALLQSRQGYLYRSDDSGATWTMVNDNSIVDVRPFYFDQLAVDPTDKNRVVVVSFNPVVSKDGGKTFKAIATDLHPDYHAIWIAPNDPKRMILGQDGGAIITLDKGANWFFSRNYAIAQIYHIATDDANPYTVCGGMQDNSGWCWPSNSRDDDGNTNAYAFQPVGGDGEWVVPDPADPNQIWADSEDGSVGVYMIKQRQMLSVQPYLGGFNGFDYSKDAYRFNWDSPIAFAPWDPHTVWYGSDVVFQSRDEGRHWTPISPDLTTNDKAHQVIPGGPVNYDVSGAETSDTILDIEGSTLARGEIWVGTDDGLVQLSRDGGKHWRNVTPPGVAPFGRAEIVSPSRITDGTAFVAIDRHFSGDEAPYLFRTTDFGAHWTSIAAGLPATQPAHVVRQDLFSPNMLYAGLDRSLWVSFDSGRSWKTLQANLPHAAIFDIQMQKRFDDLIVATHGRGSWVLDDIRPLQEIDRARAAGEYVFQPRDAYQYATTERAEGTYTEYAAPNPPAGVMITFYQAKPGKHPPVIDIYDASGHRIRHIAGTHKLPDSDKRVPFVKNDLWMNRYVWNFADDPITPWRGAANPRSREPGVGLSVVPGRYTARVTFGDGHTFSRSFSVLPDPDATWSQSDYTAAFDYTYDIRTELDNINRSLNSIDGQLARLKKAHTPAAASAVAAGTALENMLTANYKNGEDGISFPPRLREDVQGVLFSLSDGPPLAPNFAAAAIIKNRYEKAMTQVSAWLAMAKALR